jgi:peptidoglycan L-alanyl-D-glutamate endopeptidase CwlK
MFHFSQSSLGRLHGVHPDLVKVLNRAIEMTEVDFGITEGFRSAERQRQLVAAGKSQTQNSRHLTGHAVDVDAFVDGAVNWEWENYVKIARAVKKAAFDLGVPIHWGGDWITLKDGCHFELDRVAYPAKGALVA